jgi:hypothetical protein
MLRLSQWERHSLVLHCAVSVLDDDPRAHTKQGFVIVIDNAGDFVAQGMYVLVVEPRVRLDALLAAEEIRVSNLEICAEPARTSQHDAAGGHEGKAF